MDVKMQSSQSILTLQKFVRIWREINVGKYIATLSKSNIRPRSDYCLFVVLSEVLREERFEKKTQKFR